MKYLSIKEAKDTWAKLRLEYLKTCKNENGEFDLQETNESREAETKLTRFSLVCYSIPYIRPLMKAWMVDIRFGQEIPFPFKIEKEKEEEEIEPININIDELIENPDEFMTKSCGIIYDRIKNDIESDLGIDMSDMGSGMGGGHIGYPCTDHEKDLLISYVWSKYQKAMASGLVFPVVVWFKPFFEDLWDEEDIIEYYENKNVD